MPGLTVSFRKFHNCSVGVKLHLFLAYCCCTIYCSQPWVNFNKSTYSKLKVAYNNMHRRMLGYNLFVNNSIDKFDTLLCKNIYGFRKRVYDIENNLIKCMNTCINIGLGGHKYFIVYSGDFTLF